MEEFKVLARSLKMGKLEDFFLSFLEKAPSSDLVIKIFQSLEKGGYLPLPSPLFSLILDYLKEKGDYHSALEILKIQATLLPKDIALRKEAINLLKLVYPNPGIDVYINQSHLDGDREIKEGVEMVENFVKFSIGNYIFSERDGLGRIQKYDFLLEKVEIDFAGESKIFPIEDVFRNFTSLPPTHYLVEKITSGEKLKKMAEEKPLSLIVLLLKSFGRLKLSEIKRHLSGIVTNWEEFWSRVKPDVNSHPQIKVTQRKERVYEWSEDFVVEKKEGKREKEISITTLPQSMEEIIKMFQTINPKTAKALLAKIKEEREDWPEIFLAALFNIQNEKTLNSIAQEFQKSPDARGKEKFAATLQEIFTTYRFRPFQFYWLLKYQPSYFPKKALFLRVYELISDPEYKKFWRYFKTFLKKREFVEEALKEMTPEEIRNVYATLSSLPSLLDYERGEIKKILEKFSLAPERKDVIYNSEAGIKRMHERLKHLIEVELKRNAQALAQARSYGDLRENYEYKIAKEARVRLFNQINKLKEELKKAVPINIQDRDLSKVEIGTKVKMKNLITGEVKEWTILGPWDIDLEKNIISYLSPLGESLLGKKIGEKVKIDEIEFEIVAVLPGI